MAPISWTYNFKFPEIVIFHRRLQMNLKTARCQPRTGTHQATILAGIFSFLIFHILIKESSFLNSSLSQQSNLEKKF